MYNEKETQYLLDNYPAKSVEELAEELNKSPRSVIGKLSRLGIYQKKVYLNKRGERPVTKLELCARIAQAIEVDAEQLEGLDKAPKNVLKLIEEKTARRGETPDEI